MNIDSLVMKPREKKPSEWRQSRLSDNYIYERKYDGARHIRTKNGLWSKRNCNRKDRFKHIWKQLKEVNAVLDTEIYIPEGNVLDLNAKENWKDAKAVIFDVLSYEGEEYRTKKLMERKKKQKEIVKDLKGIHTPQSYTDFNEAWRDVQDNEWEGVMAKKKNSRYSSGRSRNWIKIKRKLNEDVEIVGHEEGKDTGTFICMTEEDVEIRVNVRSRDVLEEWKENEWSKAEVSYQQRTDKGKLFQPIFEKFIKT